MTASPPRVGVLAGPEAGAEPVRALTGLLERLGMACDVTVACPVRAPHRVVDYATCAEERGLRLLLAVGPDAPHLAMLAAGCTPLPVIAVPPLADGLAPVAGPPAAAALPLAAPVATVASGSLQAAAVLAAAIVALAEPEVRRRLAAFRGQQAEAVHEANRRLEQQLAGVETLPTSRPREEAVPQ